MLESHHRYKCEISHVSSQATLDGTPPIGTFPIKEKRLIEIAKELFEKGVGMEDASALVRLKSAFVSFKLSVCW